MASEEQMMKWIDEASTYELLSKWRFAPAGDPFFAGAVGEHFREVLDRRKSEDPEAWTRTSKEVGWDS